MHVEQLNESWDFFMFIQGSMNMQLCLEVWGSTSSKHYWDKWVESRSNVVYFWNRLDAINKERLLDHYISEAWS